MYNAECYLISSAWMVGQGVWTAIQWQ